MPQINSHNLKPKGVYLFPEIAKRVARFESSHPGADLIKIGIGDVIRHLPDACRKALIQAAHE